MPRDKLSSKIDVQYAVSVIHKCDLLSFVSGVYNDCNGTLSIRRHNNENLKTFESQFEAQLARFNTHGAETIPESLKALMLLSNNDLEDSQQVSILAASVRNMPGTDDGTAPSSATLLR